MDIRSSYYTSGCRGSSPRKTLWWPPSITVAGNRWKTVGYLRVSEVSGAQGEPLVPSEGPKLTPVSNDINSLTAAGIGCLGRFWWPLWWPPMTCDGNRQLKWARVGPMGDK